MVHPQFTYINMGWVTGRLDNNRPELILMTYATTDDDGYSPAASVTAYGETELKRLRDALNARFPISEETN
jgi:hypothetical protein